MRERHSQFHCVCRKCPLSIWFRFVNTWCSQGSQGSRGSQVHKMVFIFSHETPRPWCHSQVIFPLFYDVSYSFYTCHNTIARMRSPLVVRRSITFARHVNLKKKWPLPCASSFPASGDCNISPLDLIDTKLDYPALIAIYNHWDECLFTFVASF